MGEAADDAYDDAALGRDIAERMQAAGCRPCPLDHEGAEHWSEFQTASGRRIEGEGTPICPGRR